ncbi:MAG TPA: GEVED domain-containing protein [Sedimentisphaerales bacterium]|nr:GEVED domain-containing protein [Sedimentisphaerales bacterium]
MRRVTFVWAVIAATASPVFAAIVYSGSQNVVLHPMDSQIIQLGAMAGEWDDFRIELWRDMGMPGDLSAMDMGRGTHLGIFAPGSMASRMNMDLGRGMDLGMGMGGILGLALFASNLPRGALIGPDAKFLDSAYLLGPCQFGEEGGYVGLRTAMGQYGWLLLGSQSDIGTETHSVVISGWAYQTQPGLSIAAGEGGACDWAAGKPHKMHWPQLPDLASTGMDIDLTQVTLADDFKCTQSGPIRDIHLWGSFRNDVLPPQGPGSLSFVLSIYSDIPATDNRWSRPGSLLWTQTFHSGQYTVHRVHDGLEGWYDPVRGLYLRDNHRYAFQYNFCVADNAFEQQEGTIYWLAVACYPAVSSFSAAVGGSFGWKTACLQCRWNDDAVQAIPGTAGWVEMVYPNEHRYAGMSLDLAFVITGDDERKPEKDLGDAPDSSNSVAGATMLAYPPDVIAHYPTVYQAGSPPYGPIHLNPRRMVYLGQAVSLEAEADIGEDEDTVNNLDPLKGASNRDGADDGLFLPLVLPSCQTTTVKYEVTVKNALAQPIYVNMWFDWNRDGDWDDVHSCADGTAVPEWAVQNQVPLLPGPGIYTVESPKFRCWHPAGQELDPLWVRITISEQEQLPSIILVKAAAGFGGAGPAGGYLYGETEDYLVQPVIETAPLKYDWGDAPLSATAAIGYPTLAAMNGARHRPVGPWLGDNQNMPDSEADGQPDLSARGDDTAGNSDERGVIFSPLYVGQLASATVEVNGGGGVVQAWIDFNRDFTWQVGEKIYDAFLPDGVHVLPFVVPTSAAVGVTFARLRISRNGGLAPDGAAPDGEVEDHMVEINPPPTGTGEKGWCQIPDLTPRGIDICVDNSNNTSRVLADDFQCTRRGRLTDIRLWGSWKGDVYGRIQSIIVQIHPDDPVGTEGHDKENKYSKPGPEVLWNRTFVSGEFVEQLYHVMDIGYEWWWDPWTGDLTSAGDKQVWSIDMSVKPEEAFLQEGTYDKPVIYWLSIQVNTTNGRFGWKTRQWPEHFMDDAVFRGGSAANWVELQYPSGHPLAENKVNSVDLAFSLGFTVEDPPIVTSQPVAVTQCPPVETTCPALLTECPVVETCCPTVQTKCPPTKTKCPVVSTECPVYQTRCPPSETKCPSAETKCPVVETQCPVAETRCPPIETKCPPAATQCPIVLTECPVSETRCPPTPTKCKIVSTECPIVQTSCPPVPTACPAVETECPVVFSHCPTNPTTCPLTVTKCLVIKTQCPLCDTGTNLGSEPWALVGSTCLAVNTPCMTIGDYMAIARATR